MRVLDTYSKEKIQMIVEAFIQKNYDISSIQSIIPFRFQQGHSVDLSGGGTAQFSLSDLPPFTTLLNNFPNRFIFIGDVLINPTVEIVQKSIESIPTNELPYALFCYNTNELVLNPLFYDTDEPDYFINNPSIPIANSFNMIKSSTTFANVSGNSISTTLGGTDPNYFSNVQSSGVTSNEFQTPVIEDIFNKSFIAPLSFYFNQSNADQALIEFYLSLSNQLDTEAFQNLSNVGMQITLEGYLINVQ